MVERTLSGCRIEGEGPSERQSRAPEVEAGLLPMKALAMSSCT